ncbi:MAG: polyprenyl synthetase family protein [Actinobacteria bacterium]|nr:MAG: polyprenyl synthetase family protein [Actinomycetota bacterium]
MGAALPYFVPMDPEILDAPAALESVRRRVDEVLASFLLERRESMATMAPEAAEMVDELRRVVEAGGKRIRPAFCYWGYRAAGGDDGEPIVRAAAALELFHTFALIHDDVMDESETRRGQASTYARFAGARAGEPGALRFGRSVAVLVGDLAAVLADEAFIGSGFPPERLLPALRRYAVMREEVAAGQFLDIRGPAPTASADRVASLKTGAYTVEGPLHIGALLAGALPELLDALSRFARPLGLAFQLRDDLFDQGEAGLAGSFGAKVNQLIDEARSALADLAIPEEAAEALGSLAGALTLPAG